MRVVAVRPQTEEQTPEISIFPKALHVDLGLAVSAWAGFRLLQH